MVGQFGPMSTTWKLIDQPVNLPGSGFLDNNGLLCTKPEYDLEQACAAFRRVHGTHRNSPWFRLAPVLKLCSVDDAAERVRAWSEKVWESLGLNQGRGTFDESGQFVATPIKNPYASKQTTDA
ncbi:MAG TPA: hypothetical protein VHT50_02940 [Mycobacterium sp.]|nr:hypothetical protein [Mycobacterium sp.]